MGGDMKAFYRQQKNTAAAAAKPSGGIAKRKKKSTAPLLLSLPDGVEAAVGAEERESEMLREFDMDMRYGPCLGLTRIQRWERASSLGLAPPPALRALLHSAASACLWEGRV